MQIKEFRKFVKKEDRRIRKKFPISSEDKHILARMVKLTEEVGELADEVLSYNNLQRKEKMDKREKENLSGEFADVIFCVFLLAEVMKVNVEKALKEKIKRKFLINKK